MEAHYDSTADAISVRLVEVDHADRGDQVHPQAIVAILGNEPVDVEILYPTDGWTEAIEAVAKSYPTIDIDGLKAAIGSAVAAPDRTVRVELIRESIS